jgi:hypothetical protein
VHHGKLCFPTSLLGSRVLAAAVDAVFPGARTRLHLEHLFSTAGVGVAAAGFKIIVSQLRQHRWLLPTLLERGVTRLFLYRDDSFAAALSYFRARTSGVYHSDRQRYGAAPEIEADPDDFRAVLERCERGKRDVRELHRLHGGKLFTYEDMTANWDMCIASIGVELGIPRLRIPKALDRMGESRQIRIANEDKLRAEFAPSTVERRS